MDGTDFSDILGPALAGALEKKGFTALTPVQNAVLDPALAGRDLRITSQTGSGKTVAIGFALREFAAGPPEPGPGAARPRAIVVTPTRELAKQVEEELAWLYAPLHATIASATGGASYRDERRALSKGPAVVVGTPGRLLDHLNRGSIDASAVGCIVLDEADRMLDLGFREELEAILAAAPETRRTHLVAATFPREVRALADRVQRDPAHVEGTRLGAANADIDHVVHLVDSSERTAAIINLLLAHPAQTLVFARTRADVARITRELRQAGFGVSSLSGEMEQPERNRALAAFRRGDLRALVATDVAARGIDVQDIARVIHAEPPTDADTYTHRSGRTGRAGRKGTSSVLVSPEGLSRTSQLLQRARVPFRFEPVPTADDIRRSADERLYEELTSADAEGTPAPDERVVQLAERLAGSATAASTIARLLVRAARAGSPEPREVRPIEPPAPRERQGARPSARRREEAPRGARREGGPPARTGERRTWVAFRVSWGQEHGADARRLLAVMCRRGSIRGSDVGAIRVARVYSVVEVAADVAEAFAVEARKPDPRDPRVLIRPDRAGGGGAAPAPAAAGVGRPSDAGAVGRARDGSRAPKRRVR